VVHEGERGTEYSRVDGSASRGGSDTSRASGDDIVRSRTSSGGTNGVDANAIGRSNKFQDNVNEMNTQKKARESGQVVSHWSSTTVERKEQTID
jgi:hypothetical protein